MSKYNDISQIMTSFYKPKNTRSSSSHRLSKILGDQTPFVVKEAYRTARTNIIFSVSDINKSKSKLIAITSASPGEGKTTTTLNLAITFAQTGVKVLVIDGDLRKPMLHRYIGIKKDVGLSSVLSGQATIQKAIIKNARDGVDVMPSGEVPPNPAELLASDMMSETLKTLAEEYDYVFVDTPPVTVVTDAAALSPFIDGIVVVVRQNYTDNKSLASAINLLSIAKAKILGLFVNDTVMVHTGYSRYRYKYGYKYKYKYGYDYAYKHNPYNYQGTDKKSTSKKEKKQ